LTTTLALAPNLGLTVAHPQRTDCKEFRPIDERASNLVYMGLALAIVWSYTELSECTFSGQD